MRTETELILKSRWVIPERLKKEGFRFTFDSIEKALQQIVENQSSIQRKTRPGR